MSDISFCSHARTRMQQRGVRANDIELILSCATQIDENVYLLRRKDANREIERRKQEIQALERLRNQKVVFAGKKLLTTYASSQNDQKRMLRRGRGKSCME